MATYKIVSVWEPPDNKSWGDFHLKTYWLTLSDGTKCQTWRKEDSPPPKPGDEIEGDLIDKTTKAGKPYKLLKKKAELPPLVCPDCGRKGPLADFKPQHRPDTGFQKVDPVSPDNSQTPQSTSPTPNEAPGGSTEPQKGSEGDDDAVPVEKYDDLSGIEF